MADAERWGRLEKEFGELWDRFYATGRSEMDTECGALVDQLRAEYALDAPPGPSSVDVEGLRLVLHEQVYSSKDRMGDVIAYWVDEASAAFATEALLRALTFERTWLEGSGLSARACAVDEGIHRLPRDLWVRFRRAMAATDAKERAKAIEVAKAAHERGGRPVRMLLAYLFPSENFFTEEDRAWGMTTLEDGWAGSWLYVMAAISKTDLAERWVLDSPDDADLLATLGDDAVGPLRMRVLNSWGPWCRDAAAALGEIETQAAAGVLAEHAHHSHIGPITFEKLRARPAQGIRALATFLARNVRDPKTRRTRTRQLRSKPGAARNLLTSIILANRPVAEKLSRELDDDAASIVGAILDQTAPRPEAAADELPAILAAPPWRKKSKGAAKTKKAKKRAKKVPRPEPLPYEERLVWGDVDPKTLTQVDEDDPPTKEFEVEMLERLEGDRRDDGYSFLSRLCWMTDEAVLRVLKEWPPEAWYGQTDDVEAPLARLGLEVLDPLLAFCKRRSACSAGLRYVDSPRVAPLFAHCYANVKKTRETGENWLHAFPRAAAIGLIPELFDAKGKAKKAAEEGVRLLASKHETVLSEVAAEYGEEAKARVEAFIGADPSPLAQLKRAPRLPAFFDAASLPRPLLRSGKALSVESVTELATLLAVVPPGERMKEVDELAGAFERASLAHFAWSLFTEWLLSGASSKQKWAFFAVSHFGDAEAARELGPMIKEWAPGGYPSRAQLGIDVLRTMGTDAALLEIHKTAERVRSRALARHAKETMKAIAEERGLSREELADRLVPDLDLDEDGSRTFDYGRRKFSVRFDEHLVASVVDEAGDPRKDLPKPNAGDDAELADEARKAFRTLKKEAKAIAKDRIVRLERAMIEGRSWPLDTFMSFFALHPLLGHLARRLTWGVVEDDPRDVKITFRVAEDGTLADIEEAVVELAPHARIIVVHPATLDDETRGRWGDLLADYEILQPFPQLARKIDGLKDAEKGEVTLARWPDVVPSKQVLRLARRGWRSEDVQQGGMIVSYQREIGELAAVLPLEPGIYAGEMDMHPEQKIGPLTILRGGAPMVLGDVDAIVIGELIADLASVFAS